MNRFVSTAIPYVNARPHIGFALELILADSVARASRGQKESVYLLTGSDENSLKNALAAFAINQPVRSFVDCSATRFAELCPQLGISNDDFLRTSADPRHRPAVEALWRACYAAGDIYSADYEGWYCVGCEAFIDSADGSRPSCDEHPKPLERVQERNYFFRLSRYQQALIDWLDRGELQINPVHRRNEIRAFLNEPLKDLSISRSVARAHGWGIRVPDDPQQVISVWFDALANYISALGYGSGDSATFQARWFDTDLVQHVVGKGVTRFHAVYWPAILASAGLFRPLQLLVHGYVTLGGDKISKSAGNHIDPVAVCDAYGVDALRYYLLRHVGSEQDGDFTWQRLHDVYEHELANQLGNLVSRVVTLSRRHPINPRNHSELAGDLKQRSADLVLRFAPHRALRDIWEVVAAANAYASAQAPWQLIKQERAIEASAVLGELIATLRSIGEALAPLLPTTSERLLHSLRAADSEPLFPRRQAAIVRALETGTTSNP